MDARRVAPLAGAWIEMAAKRRKMRPNGVAPLAGAWIEIYMQSLFYFVWAVCRSPRGSVD